LLRADAEGVSQHLQEGACHLGPAVLHVGPCTSVVAVHRNPTGHAARAAACVVAVAVVSIAANGCCCCWRDRLWIMLPAPAAWLFTGRSFCPSVTGTGSTLVGVMLGFKPKLAAGELALDGVAGFGPFWSGLVLNPAGGTMTLPVH
jgi:hypothetical protein